MTENRSPIAEYVPKMGDRIRVTKRGPIWLWWETAVVGGSWPGMREGWATLDKPEKCGECGGPKKRTMRFRFDQVIPADAPWDQPSHYDGSGVISREAAVDLQDNIADGNALMGDHQ